MADFDNGPLKPPGAIGPGSQPGAGEDFQFMQMPRGMFRHEVSLAELPEPEEVASLEQAKRVLQELQTALTEYRCGEPARRISLDGLSEVERNLVAQLLGEGEVSIFVDEEDDYDPEALLGRKKGEGRRRVLIQEGVLTGIWQHRRVDRDGSTVEEWLEVADIPALVRDWQPTRVQLNTSTENLPEGVMSAPALLVEIMEEVMKRLDADDPGDLPAHVINLTLLPVTDADLIYLGQQVGVGPVTILSRGYGNCRIGSTQVPWVWWIKYFNSQDALILNTIEVVPVPEVAMAAPEDIEDSAERIGEIVDLYASS